MKAPKNKAIGKKTDVQTHQILVSAFTCFPLKCDKTIRRLHSVLFYAYFCTDYRPVINTRLDVFKGLGTSAILSKKRV
jgi:hypothetical protein